jgi:Ni/Co efflux regulator RcnB
VKKIISAMLATAVVLLPLAAQAGPLNNRIERQERRIYNGVRNGSLTPSESNRLNKRVDNIEAARYRAIRSGGKLTKAEKYRLNRRLNRTSDAIYRAKHN